MQYENLDNLEKEILTALIDDFSDLVMESITTRKFYVDDLKDIVSTASELLDIEICNIRNE